MRYLLLSTLIFVVGCNDSTSSPDAGPPAADSGQHDAGHVDAGPIDSGEIDAGVDAGTSCTIDGGVFAAGATDPANSCLVCDPVLAPQTWSPQTEGAQCAFGVCRAAVCTPTCVIAGVAVDAGVINPANACQTCDPFGVVTDWSNTPDGVSCGTGEVCASGVCGAHCFVDGGLVDLAVANPANACEVCDPATSVTAFSAQADGTACGAGSLCLADVCDLRCQIDGGFFDAGSLNPNDACQICDSSVSTSAWSVPPDALLLIGGLDPVVQGWSATGQQPSTIVVGTNEIDLATSTPPGGFTSGQLLLYRQIADAGDPFTVEFDLTVTAVNPHNLLDSAAALMPSFTPAFGNQADRSEMVYLDPAAIGWSDDTQSAPVAVLGNAHLYRIAVDADGGTTVSVDGVPTLSRGGVHSNGIIAVGDQTNDANVDGAMQIRSIKRICQ